jgi:ketosteroid isomerase-like protein
MPNVDTHRQLHELFNRRDWDALGAHLREDVTFTDMARGLTMKSIDDVKGWLGEWATAFSDATVGNPVYLDGGDFSVATFYGRGTNDGQLGTFAATGRRMDVAFCEILRYDGDGKVTSAEIYYDQLSIMAQLGHVEVPSA